MCFRLSITQRDNEILGMFAVKYLPLFCYVEMVVGAGRSCLCYSPMGHAETFLELSASFEIDSSILGAVLIPQ